MTSAATRTKLAVPAAFGVVGLLAFGTHFAVAAGLIRGGVAPLVANAFGFFAAFGVSFSGHSRWTFPSRQRDRRRALRRFALVAISGFAVNETLLAALLGAAWLGRLAALLIALIAAASLTFAFSRHWAFADGL